MKERPILFSGPMVRALLDGTKTQTRRVVKGFRWIDDVADGVRPYWRYEDRHGSGPIVEGTLDWWMKEHPTYGETGDRLWVKETWCGSKNEQRAKNPEHPFDELDFRADWVNINNGEEIKTPIRWTPSIFMPRWASRITLEIESVRVERLQEIGEEDALAEGIDAGFWHPHYGAGYMALWESINGKGSWADNCYVWVIQFKKV